MCWAEGLARKVLGLEGPAVFAVGRCLGLRRGWEICKGQKLSSGRACQTPAAHGSMLAHPTNCLTQAIIAHAPLPPSITYAPAQLIILRPRIRVNRQPPS